MSLTQKISLPYLESLTTHGYCDQRNFFTCLHLPSFTRLSFTHGQPGWYPSPGKEEESAFAELIRQYGHQLTEVVLDYYYCTLPTLLYCLEQLSSVETLELTTLNLYTIGSETARLDSQIVDQFIPGDASPIDAAGGCLCPRLETLRMRMCMADEEIRDSLISLVQARRCGERDLRGVRWLEELQVIFDHDSCSVEGLKSDLNRLGVSTEGLDIVIVGPWIPPPGAWNCSGTVMYPAAVR